MNDNLLVYQATSEEDLEAIRELFREYQEWLGVDLCFQGFEEELKSLPGIYAPPEGCLYLVKDRTDNRIAACVAVRPRENGRCEMKRLYVRESWRGDGLGRRLAELAIGEASSAGYSHMRLDTLGCLTAAIALYKSMGFNEIDAYIRQPAG